MDTNAARVRRERERERPPLTGERVRDDPTGLDGADRGSSTAERGGISRASRAVAIVVIPIAVFGRPSSAAVQAAVVHGETWSGRAFPGWRRAIAAAVLP